MDTSAFRDSASKRFPLPCARSIPRARVQAYQFSHGQGRYEALQMSIQKGTLTHILTLSYFLAYVRSWFDLKTCESTAFQIPQTPWFRSWHTIIRIDILNDPFRQYYWRRALCCPKQDSDKFLYCVGVLLIQYCQFMKFSPRQYTCNVGHSLGVRALPSSCPGHRYTESIGSGNQSDKSRRDCELISIMASRMG